MPSVLEERWLSLWYRLRAQGDPKKVFDDLIARYSEPHRKYHTIEHIAHCLIEFEPVRCLADQEAVELALWCHDAKYEVKTEARGVWEASNEEMSADLVMQICEAAWLPVHFAKKVAGLVLVTKHVNQAVFSFDKRLVVDIDLSILGQSAPEFDKYERQIRDEYTEVPQDVFNKKRAEILGSFLPPQRQFVYLTNFFHAKYEQQARANIRRSLTKLKTSP